MNSHDVCQKFSIKGYDSLEDLALNLRLSWNHSTGAIWRKFPRAWPTYYGICLYLRGGANFGISNLLLELA